MSIAIQCSRPNSGRRLLFAAGQVVTIVTSLLLQVPCANGQQADRDYYAPRIEQNDIGFYNNVMSHHYGPALDEMRIGRFDSALSHIEFILRYYSNQPQTLVALSELCGKWRSPVCDNAADRWFRKAIDRNPSASQSYVVMAMHLHRNNKLEESVKYYKQALDLSPESVNAHYNLGLAYTDLKRFELANQHAQVAYSKGVALPALRTRLQKAGKWDPNVKPPEFGRKPEPAAQAQEPEKKAD